MNDYKQIIWSDNYPLGQILSMTPDEFRLCFRKILGWKYLNDFDPNYVRRYREEYPLVLIIRNNPYKKEPSLSFYNWLKNDN